jgi:uracil-DNA glycosylase
MRVHGCAIGSRYAEDMPIIDHCAGCPSRDYGPAIGTRGDSTRRIVLVGEAPGAKEVVAERPFEGPAGDVLWGAVEDAELSEANVFVVNAVACRPCNPVRPKVRAPSSQAIDACHDRLAREINEHHRDVIVALGATAAKAVTGQRSFKVLTDRGKEVASLWGPIVVPTLHPAFVLRRGPNGPWRAKLVADLRHARTLARH